MRYRNFDIRIVPTAKEPFQVTATLEKGKTVRANLSLDAQIKDELGKLKSGADGLAGLKELGGRLYERLFADGLATLYAEAVRGAAPLRFRFCVDAHEAEAAAIPWEVTYQEEGDRFLSASSPNTLARYIKSQEPILGLKLDSPLKVLVVAPKGAAGKLRALVETFEQLREELPGVFDYETFEGGPAAFKRTISEGFYHVIHFLGAAGCGGEDAADYFVLDAAAGAASGSLPAESFAELVTGGRCVKLVVFDCPAAGTDGSWPTLARAATRLVRAGLPAVVAMQFPAGEWASQIFTRELYGRLCAGAEPGRIDAAVTQARECVRALCEDSADFAAPALFVGTEHGLIFYFEREAEPGAAGGGGGPGLPARVWRRLWPFAKASRAARAARRDRLRDARATHKRNVTLLREKAKRPALGPRQKARLEAQAKEERERAAELGDILWPWGKTAVLALVFSLLVAAVSEFHLLNKLGNVDNYVEHWLVDYANARRNPPIDDQQVAVVLLDTSGAQEAADVGKKQAATRRQLAELLPKLSAAGARVAVVDILFDDQTDADGELARAITRAEEPRAEQGRLPMKVLAAVERFAPQDSQPYVGAKELAAVLGGRYGVVNVAADEKSETVLRAVEVGRYLGKQPGELVEQLEIFPSLALRAVTEYKLPGQAVKTYYDFYDGVVRVGPPEPSPGDIRVPAQDPFYDRGSKVEQRALFNVWYASDGSANHTEFVNDYSGLLRRSVEDFNLKFADRIVLVTAPDLKGTDAYKVPNGKKWRGGVIQANVISNILNGQFLVRMPFRYRWLLVALMVAAGLLLHTRRAREFRKKIGIRRETAEGEAEQGVGFPVRWLGDKVQIPLVLCVIAFLYLIAAESFCEHALLVCDITYPLAALVVTYGVFGLAREAAARG